MKLRFRGNSLRLRLNQREVETVASGSALEERIAFPGSGSLSYVLDSDAQFGPRASFREGVIRVSAPPSELKQWAGSNGIGLYFELGAHGSALKIAIEKDLECVDAPPEERDPEAFPRQVGKSCE
jgi:hypothetical protein